MDGRREMNGMSEAKVEESGERERAAPVSFLTSVSPLPPTRASSAAMRASAAASLAAKSDMS